MVKSRMTALDVRASVEEMQSTLVGLRLLNIYDINEKKMFLFKFGHGENKKTVLLENGLRLHLTDLVREKPKVPSQFTLGLRKMVRAWRLDSVSQLQHDRTIDMCFGVAAVEGKSFHIIIELFGKGNVILTDHAYMIKVLLRSHKDADVNLRVGNSYPVAHADADAVVVDGVSASGHVDTEGAAAAAAALDDDTKSTRLASLKAEWETTWARNGDDETVKTTLSGVRHFGPALADNILVTMGVENKKKKELVAAGVDPSDLFDRLSQGMLEAWDLAHMALPPGGYLIRYAAAGGKKKTKPQPTEKVEGDVDHSAALAAGTEATGSTVVAERYDDFTPVLLAQFTKPSVTQVRLESFGKVCDTFFLPTEVDKIDLHNDKKDKKAESKREKFERDHQRRLSALEREQEISQRKGELLMLNAEMVDEAIALINGALATGIQWDALKVVLRRRHAEGHPVAYMIHELMLERNSISVLLEQTDLYDDEDAVDVEPEVVEVDLSKTAHANASDYFTKKKANRSKWEKTVAATDKAAAGAARKAERVAAKKETKKQIVKERARAWWEKLFWFRTTAGDVVFQGKDVQTTELLVRRTMKLGDIFVSCDVPGALPCLVRPMHQAWEEDATTTTAAAEPASPIAMASIEEAGAWCVSRSAAWESKQSMGAWWVYASQITGGTATGCYLYRGERHTLLPQPLSLGCGLLFKVARTVTADEALPARLTPAASDAPEDVMVPPDTASSLSPLPSVEALRQQQRRATQRGGPSAAAGRGARPKHGATTAPAPPPPPSAATAPASPDTHADPVSEEAAATQDEIEAVDKTAPKYHKDRKTKKLNKYFTSGDAPQPHRNARANKADDDDVAGKKGKGKGKRSQFDSESDGDDEDDTTASRPQQQQQQQPLTRHQKKKLKKIQAKYGDQDEEDRARGAMLNGNQLSKVQQRELEVQAMREREEKLAQEQEEKAARDKLKAEGKLHYHAVDDEERSADDSEASDVEEVSDFSEDADGHAGAAAAAVTDNEDNNEEADDKDEAAGEADEDAEDDNGDDGDATTEAAQTQQDDEEGRSVAPSSAASHVHDATNLSPQALAAAQANDDELKKAWVHYTSSPTADDIVEHVLCVCAPFSTLVTCGYAYRMEFVCAVNNIKKGQVAQAVIESFMRLQKQAADAAAPQEEKAKGDAASGAASKKKNNKSAATTTVTTPVITSASLLAEMANLSVNDVVEQLRGNLKPPSLRAK